jgi:hypothetical protein
VAYTYTITIPLKVQVEALEEKGRFGPLALNEKPIHFVVEFASKTSITKEDVQHAEAALKDFLKGKPVPTDTQLLRCVTKVAASCMAESKPMLDRLYTLRPTFPKVQARVVLNGHLSCQEKSGYTGTGNAAVSGDTSAGRTSKTKNNFRAILLQVIEVIGLPAWKDRTVDDFLGIAEVEAMVDLLEPLPQDKQGPIIKQMCAPNTTPRDGEQMFSPYYSLAQMQAAMVTRMQKQIAQHIVKLVDEPLTPAKRERVLALLEQLSFHK